MGSKPAATRATYSAFSQVSANTETQSMVRQAGTMPYVLSKPRVGFSPTMLLKAAGTRPEPAVSVPNAKLTRPADTATAEPELEPPGIKRASNGLRALPYADRTPTSPVANWSRFVFPIRIPPASRIFCTTVAVVVASYANAGQPAVVGRPATSMLSLTAKGIP